MWLLSFIPDFVYHLLLLTSIIAFGACYILKMIPFISANVEIIRVISVVVMIFSVWMEGGIVNEAKWKARVAELEIKVAKAEKVAAEANGKIETVYVDRVKVEKEVQYVVQNLINKNSAKLDLTCKVDPLAINILNKAAVGGVKK
jgi:uncharacterized coiled-coil protein SlyX